MTGELEATKKRLRELETKCSEEFDCEITALPGFIKQLETEAEKSLKNAESVLGMNDEEPAKSDDGTSGQDRESYSDDQDREDYIPEDEDDGDALV